MGSDLFHGLTRARIGGFQSTLPVWGATLLILVKRACPNISIHAPRVGSDADHERGGTHRNRISIHAPRVGSDRCHHPQGHGCVDFNPRSPCGERPCSCASGRMTALFQSTLPVWGATDRARTMDRLLCISIHAPRVGSDPRSRALTVCRSKFQSTLPVWGATDAEGAKTFDVIFQSTLPVWGATQADVQERTEIILISIHAPRVGSDHHSDASFPGTIDFNPRSPCGERLVVYSSHSESKSFQSTLPVWGATGFVRGRKTCRIISIHAPRVGSDVSLLYVLCAFLSISIHAPRVGSDDNRLESCK